MSQPHTHTDASAAASCAPPQDTQHAPSLGSESEPSSAAASSASAPVLAPSTPLRAQADRSGAPSFGTPRSRARSCAPLLVRLDNWGELISDHRKIMRYYDTHGQIDEYHVVTLIGDLRENRSDLAACLPEVADILNAIPKDYRDANDRMGPRICAAYTRLYKHLADFTKDEALAFILIHLPLIDSRRRDLDVVDTNAHLATNFALPYHGDAHLRFLRFVQQVNLDFDTSDDICCYRGTPIVQSSGTGKTRMVVELRKYAPLLYVCLRSPSVRGNAKAGYPFPDHGVLEYFVQARASPNLTAACFLAAWFNVLADHLAVIENEPENVGKPAHTIDELKFYHLVKLNEFEQRHGNNLERDLFFKSVSDEARLRLNQTFAALDQPFATLNDQSSDEVFAALLPNALARLRVQLRDVLRHLRTIHPDTPEPPILVAFDESHELNTPVFGSQDTQLDGLRRAWKYIGDCDQSKPQLPRFWLVLISTNSSAAHLIEQMGQANSARRRESAPLPVFVALKFDVFADGNDSVAKAAEASDFEHIIKYGRPLWKSLQRNGFWGDAKYKLLGAQAFSITSPLHCYSVLASRLALGLVPAHSSSFAAFQEQKTFVQDAVDRHMRIATNVSSDGSMHVKSFSEPVLALAASLLMLPDPRREPWRTGGSEAYGEILANFHRGCLVGDSMPLVKGTYGELAARLALTAAWDAVKRVELDRALAPPMHRPFTVVDHVEILTEPVRVETVLSQLAALEDEDRARLDDHLGAVRRKVCERLDGCAESKVQAWMHYTHIDVLSIAISQISPDYLWYCWKRGVALQMAHAQHGIDGIIPVFVGDLNRSLASAPGADGHPSLSADEQAARQMTFVAWKAKQRADAQPRSVPLAATMAGPPLLALADEAPLTRRALVAVLLDLGTAAPFENTRDQIPQLDEFGDTDCVRLNIRGTTHARAYPCLDTLKIRDRVRDLLATISAHTLLDQLSTFHSPL